MSCTVLAVPYTLAWVIGAVVKVVIDTTSEIKDENLDIDSTIEENYSFMDNIPDTTCDDIHVISEITLMEKKLETPFMDKNILIKTLEEHGVKNIIEEYGKIKGEVDSYSLVFEKMEENLPYFVKISYLKQNNPEEKLNDLSSEYALNVQEDAYLNIIEKLQENNMQIEDEEVLDDNTIVLTINLEN